MIVSVHAEDQYALRALRAGAVGYVTKETAPIDLTAAVRKVVEGGKYVSPNLVERMVESLAVDAAGKPLHHGLTDRELQVLRMLAGGKSVKAIGVEMALSEKTISTYRARVLRKLNLRSTAELMRFALRVGLVD